MGRGRIYIFIFGMLALAGIRIVGLREKSKRRRGPSEGVKGGMATIGHARPRQVSCVLSRSISI